MPVAFRNYEFSYINRKGKPVFVPTKEVRELGKLVRQTVAKVYNFGPEYRHFRRGGHVGALHQHLHHEYFGRLDLRNFFYTVRRNRVDRALASVGVRGHEHFSKWSTVKDPYSAQGYVLPYGFPQSPILASLVMARSNLGALVSKPPRGVASSVFLDDISISGDEAEPLTEYYQQLVEEVTSSGFVLNADKSLAPASRIELFNCDLIHGSAEVTAERRDIFYAEPHGEEGVMAFEAYCDAVSSHNLISQGR